MVDSVPFTTTCLIVISELSTTNSEEGVDIESFRVTVAFVAMTYFTFCVAYAWRFALLETLS